MVLVQPLTIFIKIKNQVFLCCPYAKMDGVVNLINCAVVKEIN